MSCQVRTAVESTVAGRQLVRGIRGQHARCCRDLHSERLPAAARDDLKVSEQ